MLSYFSTKCQCFFVLFAKTTCLQKSDSSDMIQKPENAGFFKPQYLTKKLRHKVEFLDMIIYVRESTKY